MFWPFNFFISKYSISVAVSDKFYNKRAGFSSISLGSLVLCVLCMSCNFISRSNFSFRVLIITSFVISSFSSAIPCAGRQFLLEYCSCWSWIFSILSTLIDRLSTSDFRSSIILSFFALSSLYSSNLSGRKFMNSFRSFYCFLPLIWYSCIECANMQMSFVCLPIFLKQLKRICMHSGDFKLFKPILNIICHIS